MSIGIHVALFDWVQTGRAEGYSPGLRFSGKLLFRTTWRPDQAWKGTANDTGCVAMGSNDGQVASRRNPGFVGLSRVEKCKGLLELDDVSKLVQMNRTGHAIEIVSYADRVHATDKNAYPMLQRLLCPRGLRSR